MQRMQSVFNSRMEPIKTHEEYPKYARSETKPVIRARTIIDNGIISIRPCSTCVELKQDCYRWEGTFSKCAYCTSKDRKRELCHLPGEIAPPKPEPERRKRRKITGNIYAPVGKDDDAGNATPASATTPFVPHAHMSINTRSLREGEMSREPASAVNGVIHTPVMPPAAAEAGSRATLERVTALENQVSGLEAKVFAALFKLDEVSSRSVSTSSTPQPQQAAAGASPVASDVMLEDLQARNLSRVEAKEAAIREWVEEPNTAKDPLPM